MASKIIKKTKIMSKLSVNQILRKASYFIPLRFRLLIASLYYRLLRKKRIHFLHIGKTGGTAVKEALKHFQKYKDTRIWLHNHKVTLVDIPQGDKVIFFIRDPISRFVSGFYSRKRQGRPRYNAPWTPEEKEAFQNFRTPNELAKSIFSPDQAVRKKAIHAMRGIYHVNTFLKDWLISKDYILRRKKDILFIGCQESLDKDFELLKKLLGLPRDIELPKDPMKAHKNPPNIDKSLDKDAIENLRKWYAHDYELYDFLLKMRSEILQRIREDF